MTDSKARCCKSIIVVFNSTQASMQNTGSWSFYPLEKKKLPLLFLYCHWSFSFRFEIIPDFRFKIFLSLIYLFQQSLNSLRKMFLWSFWLSTSQGPGMFLTHQQTGKLEKESEADEDRRITHTFEFSSIFLYLLEISTLVFSNLWNPSHKELQMAGWIKSLLAEHFNGTGPCKDRFQGAFWGTICQKTKVLPG